ncbi:DUF3037 domain-containing protein [Panacibacter ginsenosidivorans]|uniref:DUF3037 domain-containing protein n=1 Tax=Panacibacter ginsenosidivorans TaxID=1813871 RepID=A0A5B8V5H2_9BACT|nr:DUF3037 domain-containing protein [Panacibacter ginsenosidivorans]QEC66747.1 DUF3037 domain-containing protein [Panacibacter ginsenosidivorans]
MQEKQLFEYAVIRVVPCVEREEFINAGVVVYCAAQNFLQAVVGLNEERFLSLSTELDIDEVQKRLKAFVQIAAGVKEGGTIATLPIASRFRWLTATRSTIVQTSAVHPGLCTDAKETLMKLYEQLVV